LAKLYEILKILVLGNEIGKVRGKVVPAFLTEHHDMKAYWGCGGIAPRILGSAIGEGEW
jgi:hypothetical protein